MAREFLNLKMRFIVQFLTVPDTKKRDTMSCDINFSPKLALETSSIQISDTRDWFGIDRSVAESDPYF